MPSSSGKLPQDSPKESYTNSGTVNFSVGIAASGCTNTNTTETPRLVHAVSVAQHVQSWTVLREHRDFLAVSNALASTVPGLPPCPDHPSPQINPSSSSNDISWIAQSQNALQEWLTSILSYPGVRETPAIRQFLCFGANMMPPEYHVVNWIPFTRTSSSQQQLPPPSISRSTTPASSGAARNLSLDEMEMDDMFDTTGGVYDEEELSVGSDDDAPFEYSAAARYQPTTEKISREDVMDIQSAAAEMVEDVGSLAQSMGASHLGRSLQLQAQMASEKERHHFLEEK